MAFFDPAGEAAPDPVLAESLTKSAAGGLTGVLQVIGDPGGAIYLSGGGVIVACTKARPFWVTGVVTDAMPGVPARADRTAPALAAVEVICTGSPDPAGKWVASTFCAVTDGWVPRKD